MNKYNSFLVIIESNYTKQFGFFVPAKFEYVKNEKTTKKQLAFYQINNSTLVTATNSVDPKFGSDDDYFIGINYGLVISNKRNKIDSASLNSKYWQPIIR